MSYVFISYVRENQLQVERLRDALDLFEVHTWLDRDSIQPGTPWQPALKTAIQQGSFFLACFSKEFHLKVDSYMQDELRLAIQQLEFRPADDRWFIPVRLSDCEIPKLPSKDGRTIRDIQWIDLFDDWEEGIARIVNVIRPQWLVDKEKAVRKKIIEEGCNLHIQSKIKYFTSNNALRIREIENRWLSLIAGNLAQQFLETTVNLFDRAVSANSPMTERLVEPGDDGRVILISAIPTYDEKLFLRSLHIQNREWDSYPSFVKDQRRNIRNLPNWQNRDLVHWVFRQEGPKGEMEIDLLYLCNINLMFHVIMYQTDMAEKEGVQQMPVEQIYPTTLMTVFEIDQLVSEIIREEAPFSS